MYGILNHMILFQERAFFRGGVIEIELHDDLTFRLRYGELVEYEGGRKRVRGRASRYEFRSVEQLRYDFERDVIAAGGSIGEAA
jgi:hypothetical protein